jgi:hypothetical protein
VIANAVAGGVALAGAIAVARSIHVRRRRALPVGNGWWLFAAGIVLAAINIIEAVRP